MKDKKMINNSDNKLKINHKEKVSADFFDYFEDDEPYQEIQIT